MTTEKTFCPATMCPLFAREGSPWTGTKNAPCAQKPAFVGGEDTDYSGCAFFNDHTHCCDGAGGAFAQIDDVARDGRTLQVGPVQQKRDVAAPRSYDCPRAHDCQWQREAGDKLCPPRYALAQGIDPRACAW